MEQVIQVTGLCVVGALLALVVKRGSPETALLLAVGAPAVVALALAGVGKELVGLLGELGSGRGVFGSEQFVGLLPRGREPAVFVRSLVGGVYVFVGRVGDEAPPGQCGEAVA